MGIATDKELMDAGMIDPRPFLLDRCGVAQAPARHWRENVAAANEWLNEEFARRDQQDGDYHPRTDVDHRAQERMQGRSRFPFLG